MHYLIVLLLAVSASATYDYSYLPSSYGHHYDGYYGLGGYGGARYGGVGYGVGGYSYAPSYYHGGAAVSKYISPAVHSYAAPAAVSYAAPAAATYATPAVAYAAAPAVTYAKPAVTYAAAPAVSYVAPRVENPLVRGGSFISFTMGTARKALGGISPKSRGTVSNLPKHTAGGETPHSAPDHSTRSGVRPGVVYAEDRPAVSNEKPSDSPFFDATRSSEADTKEKISTSEESGETGLDSPFFDATRSSDEAGSSDSKEKISTSTGSDKSGDFVKPSEHSSSAFDADGDSDFEKADEKIAKDEISAHKPKFPLADRSSSSSAGHFLSGAPKIKFVMGSDAGHPRGVFREIPDRPAAKVNFGSPTAGQAPVLLPPSSSLLYDAGNHLSILNEPQEDFYVLEKK